MAKGIDPMVRDRIRDWLRFKREELRPNFPNEGDFADYAGIDRGQMSRLLSRSSKHASVALGLDVLLSMRTKLKMNVNDVIDLPAPAVREAERRTAR